MRTNVNWQEAVVPNRTQSYEPVSHAGLIQTIKAGLENHGFEIGTTRVRQNKQGTVISGDVKVLRPEAEDFVQTFGFINSYNKSKPVTFASGAEVFICENGMIVSEFVTMRKHTVNVWGDIDDKLNSAIGQLDNNWDKMNREIEVMRSADINKVTAAEILGRLFVDERILSSDEVNEAARQLRKPRFEDFTKQNLWSLYNHCTWAMKHAHPADQQLRLKGLHNFCVDYANDFVTVNG